MTTSSATTIVAAFERGEPSQPLITFYDDATGERTELSRATLANWVAKTANLLVCDLGLDPGDVAAIRLPPHWQSAAVLLGCWSAGLRVDLGDGGHLAEPAAVAFVTADLVGAVRADEVLALGLAPLAAPLRPGPPDGSADYVVRVRGQADQFTAVEPVGADTPALIGGGRHRDLLAAARRLGVPAGARVLIDADRTPDPLTWLVAPVVVGTSVVLCRHLDLARLPDRLARERAVAYQ